MGKVCRAEEYLIPSDQYKDYYDIMPDECKKVVDGPPDCVGVAYDVEVGWFIMGAGQGPGVCWAENPDKFDKKFGKLGA